MLLRRRRVVALVMASVLFLGVSAWFAAPAAADLPGTDCPKPPGTGTTRCEVLATLPSNAGQNANGVCINCNGTGGQNNTAVLARNALGCVGVASPTVGAGGSYVWADWGDNDCVAPGQNVKIQFLSGGSALEVVSVTWNLANDTTLAGTGTVDCAAVGGIAELPPVAGASAEEAGTPAQDSGWSSGAYAALAAGVAAAVVALSAGTWYVRRRRLS